MSTDGQPPGLAPDGWSCVARLVTWALWGMLAWAVLAGAAAILYGIGIVVVRMATGW